MRRFNRRRRRRYGACPECSAWSVLVQPNGRVARHSVGLGYVERFPPGHPFKAGLPCKGSGALIMEPLPKAQWYVMGDTRTSTP